MPYVMFGVCEICGVVKISQKTSKALERKGDILSGSHFRAKLHPPYPTQKPSLLYQTLETKRQERWPGRFEKDTDKTWKLRIKLPKLNVQCVGK